MTDDSKQDGKQEKSKQEEPQRSFMEQTRREFLMLISMGAGGLASLAVVAPVLTFLLAPLFKKSTPVWNSVGYLDQFKLGDTVEVSLQDSSPLAWGGTAQKAAAWLRRDTDTSFTAFSVDCTHLGCPVRWEAQAELFMCPCHGGVYYKNGDVAAGPPPDPLQQYPVRVQNGVVQVQWRVLPDVPPVAGCLGCGDNNNPVRN